jgi:hypothetical protein
MKNYLGSCCLCWFINIMKMSTGSRDISVQTEHAT